MQKVTNIIARRWQSGCMGKLVVIAGGVILGLCLCSVPMAIISPSTPTPMTRSRPVVDIEATPTREPRPTSTLIPTRTPPPAMTNTPVPPTATLVPPTAVPTNTPRPAPTNTPLPPAPPPVRGGNTVNPFTCVGGCSEPPDPSCGIKGNISQSSGEKIYHTPGQRDYDRTDIDPARGERWFCTPAEAEAAGWRAAMR